MVCIQNHINKHPSYMVYQLILNSVQKITRKCYCTLLLTKSIWCKNLEICLCRETNEIKIVKYGDIQLYIV